MFLKDFIPTKSQSPLNLFLNNDSFYDLEFRNGRLKLNDLTISKMTELYLIRFNISFHCAELQIVRQKNIISKIQNEKNNDNVIQNCKNECTTQRLDKWTKFKSKINITAKTNASFIERSLKYDSNVIEQFLRTSTEINLLLCILIVADK